MAFDFPSNPTDGQTFQPPGGPLYVFRPPAWKVESTSLGVPPSTGAMFARNTPPSGWLKANGALISRHTYADLFLAIGITFGAGDGSTTFALPDLRGEFPRAWDDARGVDAGRTFGSAQADDTESHSHAISFNTGAQSADHTHVASGTTGANSVGHTHTFSDASSATGGISANHTHVTLVHNQSQASIFPGGSYGTAATPGDANLTSGGNSVGHTHNVAVSGTTSGISANHTHTFSDTTTGVSVGHTHLVSGTSGLTGGTETRPRNIALLACIKY